MKSAASEYGRQDALDRARNFGFVTIPGFSILTLSAAWEPFRIANAQSGKTIYTSQTLSVHSNLVRSANGITISADKTVAEENDFDIVFVISSLQAAEFRDRALERWLQGHASRGTILAPLGSATILAARLGLLNGYRCVTHWKHQEEFAERFPNVSLSPGLYSIDRDRLTAAGGISALDLGLSVIARGESASLAKQVAEEMMHSRLRRAAELQRMDTKIRYDVTDPRVVRALDIMEAHLEHPLSLSQIANVAAISERQLERLFMRYLGKRPLRVYLDIRLRFGRELVMRSTYPVSLIAARCGFSDASHFNRHYRVSFGEPPSHTRRAPVAPPAELSPTV